MLRVSLIVCVWCAGCKPGDPAPAQQVIPDARIEPAIATSEVADTVLADTGHVADLVLRDTSEYSSDMASGTRAILYHQGVELDTVDLRFGVRKVSSGGLVFLPVRTIGPPNEWGPQIETHVPVLWTNGVQTPLHELLPGFSPYFSSPAVIDSLLYYWIWDREEDSSVYLLTAARHDFTTSVTTKTELGREDIATDNPEYLTPPYVKNGMVVYESPNAHWTAFPVQPRK